jgi:hypothetical protein
MRVKYIVPIAPNKMPSSARKQNPSHFRFVLTSRFDAMAWHGYPVVLPQQTAGTENDSALAVHRDRHNHALWRLFKGYRYRFIFAMKVFSSCCLMTAGRYVQQKPCSIWHLPTVNKDDEYVAACVLVQMVSL